MHPAVLARPWISSLSDNTGTSCAPGLVDMHCGPAVRGSGPTALAMIAAMRWLVRSAARVKVIRSQAVATASACTTLVSFLPGLEDVQLGQCAPVSRGDLGRLLEALAGCPRLSVLDLNMWVWGRGKAKAFSYRPFPAPALAKLSSLTSLWLGLGADDPYTLPDVVGALAALTGLVKLSFGFPAYADIQLVPAALGKLKALHSLKFMNISNFVFEAGCLDLPKLQSLDFFTCEFPDAEALRGVSALQCLTGLEFIEGKGPVNLDPELARLPRLQSLVLTQEYCSDTEGPLRLPAIMGLLSNTLLHLDISVHMSIRFPLAVTQLVALEHLNAKENGFAELPAGITALSRLTELQLGLNSDYDEDPKLYSSHPLDVRALGALSRFPGLQKLTFESCKVMLCCSVLGAARHASLASLCFDEAHPAPECAPVVLQLGQELWRLGRGSVLRCISSRTSGCILECCGLSKVVLTYTSSRQTWRRVGWRRMGYEVLVDGWQHAWSWGVRCWYALIFKTHLANVCNTASPYLCMPLEDYA